MEGSEIDVGAAVSEIADGLGFEVSEGGEDGNDGNLAAGADLGTEGLAGGESGAEGGDTGTETGAGEESAAGDPAAPPPVKYDPPKTWRPEALATWEALPEAAKVEVLKREEDIFRGLEAYKADANIGRVTKQVFQPYMEALQREGVNPADLTGRLLSSHFNLLYASQEVKVATFQALAREYGVDLDGSAPVPPYVDPQVADLRSQLSTVQSHLKATEQRQVQAQMDLLNKEISTFASDPAHQYFDEVANDIAALIRSGAATNLKDAYDKAIWANPVTRAKEQARISADAAKKAAAEAAEKAKAARRATSANVRPTAKAVSGTAPLGSMDDTLKAALAKIQARDGQ